MTRTTHSTRFTVQQSAVQQPAERPPTIRRRVNDRVVAVLSRVGDRERGDVPGWVLITLMTAGLVVAIWAVAGPALTVMFDDALKSVKGP